MIKPHIARLAVVACAIPALVHAQPVAAPVALTYNRADTLPISADPMRAVELAERSRMHTVKKGTWIGAAAGAVLGFAASTHVAIGGCEPSVRIYPDGSTGKMKCSHWSEGLVFGGLVSLAGGTVGGVLGAGVGAVFGGRSRTQSTP